MRSAQKAPFPFATLPLVLGLAASLAPGCASNERMDVRGPEGREIPLMDRVTPENGTIISVLGTGIAKDWEELGGASRAMFTEDEWETARETVQGHADLLTYSSDGLRIGGLLVRPGTTEGRRLGAVIVNRDGIAGRGLDEDLILADLSRYAREGFVAATSAYRGNRMSQGTDEFGGDDVNDVHSLIALLQRLDYVDPGRIFMVGFGRGGLMTYLALEGGAPVRAAAVISGAADVTEMYEADDEIATGFRDSGGWPGLEGIYDAWGGPQRREELERRTPRYRADALTTPLLVVHGRLDETVPVEHALCVTTRVRKAGTPIEAVVYGYGDHALIEQRKDWQDRVLDWIKRHDTRSLLN